MVVLCFFCTVPVFAAEAPPARTGDVVELVHEHDEDCTLLASYVPCPDGTHAYQWQYGQVELNDAGFVIAVWDIYRYIYCGYELRIKKH